MKEGAHAGLRLDLACEDPQFCEKQARQRAREAHKKAIATYARIRLLSMELRQQATEARLLEACSVPPSPEKGRAGPPLDLPLARVTVASPASAQKRRPKSSPHNDVPQSGPWKCIRRATAAAVAQCRAASWVAQFCMLACLTPKLVAAGLVAAFALVVGSALTLGQALSGALASEMRTLWAGVVRFKTDVEHSLVTAFLEGLGLSSTWAPDPVRAEPIDCPPCPNPVRRRRRFSPRPPAGAASEAFPPAPAPRLPPSPPTPLPAPIVSPLNICLVLIGWLARRAW